MAGVDVNAMAVIAFSRNGTDIIGVLMSSQRSHKCTLQTTMSVIIGMLHKQK